MKHFTVVLLTALIASTLVAETPRGDESNAGLAKLKQLVGTWRGLDPAGKALTISYKLISDDNSLMETINMADKMENMVTIYHLDNGKAMMTHYCSMGNQPRMRLEKTGTTANKLTFSFLDATNLKSKEDAHMHKLMVTFKDNDHFTQEWFMRAKGKETPVIFNLERVK